MTQQELNCEQALRQLFDFLDRELEPAERAAMQRHMSTCRSCYSRMDFERRLKEKLGELRREEPPETATARVKRLLESF